MAASLSNRSIQHLTVHGMRRYCMHACYNLACTRRRTVWRTLRNHTSCSSSLTCYRPASISSTARAHTVESTWLLSIKSAVLRPSVCPFEMYPCLVSNHVRTWVDIYIPTYIHICCRHA
ncbi:unnamed protein product [Periconia digitata]|uniref:Uncharacterized protein n=1 Tax=Periconia digitata TaxID=1303443 RepID=A0A9W4XZC9_9PLEO|nr:unnamed protein product [Periconia digitata]